MDLFKEGQRIALFFLKDTSMVEIMCSIEKIYDDRLDIVLPQYFMRYIKYLQVGSALTAKVFTKLGNIDFNTVVISSPLEDEFTIELDYNSLKLTSGEELPVINAIEHLDVEFKGEVYKLKTFEIADRYVKFYSDNAFQLENVLKCSLILPEDYGIIEFTATISEIDQVYENEYTANYSTISESAKQSLLYYMYMYSKNSD